MKAITFQDVKQVRFQSVPDPKILAPTDAIIRVDWAGVCGSDLHVYHGRECGLDVGTVMGHELVGEVVDVGGEVRSFRPGQKVMSPFTTNCGQCDFCTMGMTCRCRHGHLFGWVQDGQGLHGAQAEYVRVPLADGSLHELPEGVEPELGLLLGDVLPTGYFCADMAEIHPGGVYVVLGCGPVGLMAVVGAAHLGAKHLFAVDRVEERLQLAQSFGATPLNFDTQDVHGEIMRYTDGKGADAVLEVVGSAAASRMAYEMVRPGGIIATVGVHTSPQFSFTPAEAYDKNLTFKIGRCPARHYMEKLIPLVKSGKWDLAKIISHRLPLEEGVAAYRMFDEKRLGCTKAILNANP